MGFFDRLFGRKVKPEQDPDPATEQNSPAPDEFIRTPFIQDRIVRYQRQAIALRPYNVDDVTIGDSHFGGSPNMVGFTQYPECVHCKAPLDLILQVYVRDVPGAYFPDESDLFQVFRCPRTNCKHSFEHYDNPTFAFYTRTRGAVKELARPDHGLSDAEPTAKMCAISPKTMADMPNYDDYDENEPAIEEQFGEELAEHFIEEHSALSATKFGGWPSFTQSPYYPTCNCGKVKEFFFQFASEDKLQVEGQPINKGWSPHGIMMGDVGNIYFYVCKSCGPSSIESYFDCC